MKRLNGPIVVVVVAVVAVVVVVVIVIVVVVGLDGAGNEGLGLFVKEVLHAQFFLNGCLAPGQLFS